MRGSQYTRAVDRIVENFGGTRRLHPNTWRIPVTASRGYFTLGTSSYRNRASISLDRLYENPALNARLRDDFLLIDPPNIGGAPGTWWAVWGLDSATALTLIPEILRSDLDYIDSLPANLRRIERETR